MRTTPSGSRTLRTCRPLGRSHSSVISPTGSFRPATDSTARAMASTREVSSSNRSRKAPPLLAARAAAMSASLAERRVGRDSRRWRAMARRASSFWPVGAVASTRAAARAVSARERTSSLATDMPLLYHRPMSDARLEQFKQMAAEFPDSPMAHFSLGKAFLERRQYAEAAQALETAVRLDPQYAAALVSLGDALAG